MTTNQAIQEEERLKSLKLAISVFNQGINFFQRTVARRSSKKTLKSRVPRKQEEAKVRNQSNLLTYHTSVKGSDNFSKLPVTGL